MQVTDPIIEVFQRIGRRLYERGLNHASSGNMSLRVGDR